MWGCFLFYPLMNERGEDAIRRLKNATMAAAKMQPKCTIIINVVHSDECATLLFCTMATAIRHIGVEILQEQTLSF